MVWRCLVVSLPQPGKALPKTAPCTDDQHWLLQLVGAWQGAKLYTETRRVFSGEQTRPLWRSSQHEPAAHVFASHTFASFLSICILFFSLRYKTRTKIVRTNDEFVPKVEHLKSWYLLAVAHSFFMPPTGRSALCYNCLYTGITWLITRNGGTVPGHFLQQHPTPSIKVMRPPHTQPSKHTTWWQGKTMVGWFVSEITLLATMLWQHNLRTLWYNSLKTIL